jgi:hypothetical protein
MWSIANLYSSGVLAVALAGDFNLDGAVDAADYVMWVKTGGALQAYDDWTVNFGRIAGTGSRGEFEVPEPGGMLLLASLAITGALLSTNHRPQ